MARMEVKEWKKYKILGAGSYGKVHLAAPVNFSLYPPSASLVAVKSAKVGLSTSLQKERMFLGELKGEPHIIRCFGDDISLEDSEYVYNLLLEYAPGGSLHDFIKKNRGTIPESHVACYTYMILRGLCAIHESGTIHCDLKPSNILLFPNRNNKNGIHLLKIADLGLARRVWDDEKPVWGRMGFNDRCTPIYASPESVLGFFGTANDIWSLGCVVVEMIKGEPLWSCRTREDLLNKFMFEDPKIPENLSKEGKDFLMKCFERYDHMRGTTEELLHHPFIVKNLKFLDNESHHSSIHCSRVVSDESLRNPFGGFGDWIATHDLFSAKSSRKN